MRRVKKVWLRGFASGVAMTFVLGSGMYYIENGKLPFTGDSLGTGASGRKLQAIEKLIDEEYLGEIDKAVMEDYMYYGVVSSLGDRYSQYVTAEQYADLTQSSNGVYVGVGVVMQQDPETKIISVVQCYENSPAEKAGVLVALTTDHPVSRLQYLPLCASLAVKEGMDEHAALRAITIDAASICNVSDRVGSLKVGKDADIVLYDGHPLDWKSSVKMTIVNGEIVWKDSRYSR